MSEFLKNVKDYLINAPQVVASIFALVGVLLTILKTSSNNKKSIKTNARIDWIQKVRNEVSELLALYSCVNEVSISNEQLYQIEKKTNLLILYFGPDSSKNAKSPNTEKGQDTFQRKLLNDNSNAGKNQYIVKFLEDLLIALKDCSKNNIDVARNKVLSLTEKLVERNIRFDDNGDIVNESIPKDLEDSDILWDTLKEYDDWDSFYNELSQKRDKIKNDIVVLRDCFRIYFKIEWDISKKGK